MITSGDIRTGRYVGAGVRVPQLPSQCDFSCPNSLGVVLLKLFVVRVSENTKVSAPLPDDVVL